VIDEQHAIACITLAWYFIATVMQGIEIVEEEWLFTFALHRHTHPFNGPLSGTTQVSWYQKGKTNLDFTEARDSEWQWHQLGHIQVCTSLQTNNHASTPPLRFLQAGCPSCRPTNSVKALKGSSKHFCFSSQEINLYVTARSWIYWPW